MKAQQKNQFNSEFEEEPTVDYRQFLTKYLAHWLWFLISILLCLTIAYLYVKSTTPMYKISARVLVNDEKKGGGLSGNSLLGDLGGLLGGKSTVDNEAEILKTRSLMDKVVKDLQLNISYYKKERFRQVELYEAPFRVEPVKLNDSVTSTIVKLDFLKNGKVALLSEDLDTLVHLNQILSLPGVGYIKIVMKPNVQLKEQNYSFGISSVDNKVLELMGNLDVAVANKLVTIIDLSLNNAIPRKGEDILSRLIYNYVQGNLSDKNEVADSTIAFIKRRLMIIGDELGDAEGNIQGFKQKNSLADMSEQGKLLVATSGQYISDLGKIETQISIVKSVIDYLKEDVQNKRILPSTLLPGDVVFAGAIEKYNTLLLERGRKLIGLTESNPIILNLDKEIGNARTDIESNLTSTLNGLIITRNKLSKQMEGAEGQIRQVPATERNYLKLARQQQIKQELYIFLMQKSEETAISKTANIANSKTIDPPKAQLIPYAPKTSRVFLIGFLIGIICPIIIIYLKDILNNKVQNKEDIIKRTTVPIVGEISQSLDNTSLAVAHSTRSAIAEQFRGIENKFVFLFKRTGRQNSFFLPPVCQGKANLS